MKVWTGIEEVLRKGVCYHHVDYFSSCSAVVNLIRMLAGFLCY